MSNDFTLSKPTISQPTTSITPSISQQGQKNTLIQHADNVIINATQKTIPTIVPNQPLTPNTDYYNLIVDGMIDIENPEICFSIEPSRALTEYIDDDVKKYSHFYQMMQFSRFKPFLLFLHMKTKDMV